MLYAEILDDRMMNSRNILSTRRLAKPLADKIRATGFSLWEADFIETTPVVSTQIKQQIHHAAGQKCIAVFTSVHAVGVVLKHLENRPPWRIFCISGTTQKNLRALFEEADIVSAPDAAQLAGRILSSSGIQEVLFFCGDKRLNTIPQILRTQGIQVKEHVVYTTQLTPKLIKGAYDGILFFSPSAVTSFFSENAGAGPAILFSLGKTTSLALKEYTDNVIITSPVPRVEAMIDCVINHYK